MEGVVSNPYPSLTANNIALPAGDPFVYIKSVSSESCHFGQKCI